MSRALYASNIAELGPLLYAPLQINTPWFPFTDTDALHFRTFRIVFFLFHR